MRRPFRDRGSDHLDGDTVTDVLATATHAWVRVTAAGADGGDPERTRLSPRRALVILAA